MENTERLAALTLAQVRDVRRACADVTPGHPRFPGSCPMCQLGVTWLPHEGPQEEFVGSEVRELLYGGQAGGGKSAALVAMPLRWVGHPEFNGIILRRDTTQLVKLLKEADALYPKAVPGAQRRMKGDAAVWRFPSGAQVRFEHCLLESDIARYDGDEFQYVGFDELTHFTLSQFTGLGARIRASVAGLPRYSRATSNPGGEGHAWVFERWRAWLDPQAKIPGLPDRFDEWGQHLPPARPGQVLWFHPETDQRVQAGTPLSISRTFIPAKLSDNPSLEQNDPDYRAGIMALDPVRRAQLLRGDWLAKPGRGVYFKRGWFKMVEVAPTEVVSRVRTWDLAATEETPGKKSGDPDWTVGELWSKTKAGSFILEDVIRFRGRPLEVERAILNTAKADGRKVEILLPQDPGQAGKAQAEAFVRLLAGFIVRTQRPTGDKVTRAGPFSAQVEGGNVYLVEARWNAPFFEELEAFPEGAHDDQVDPGADAIGHLSGVAEWSDLTRYKGTTPKMSEEELHDAINAPFGGLRDYPDHSTDTDQNKRTGRW